MEQQGKLTKEAVAQEAQFILDHLLTASKYTPEVQVEELRRLCEQSVSLRLGEYVSFLDRFGYLSYDRATHMVTISGDGERVVSGEKMAELVVDVVHHFRSILAKGGGERSSAAPQAGAEASPGRLDERYEKLALLGSGGIGTVYRAKQLMLDRQVALKEINELFTFFTEPQRQEIVRRFDEEVRRAAVLRHPNVARIVDANTRREHPYVVTEWIGGGSLRTLLVRAKELSPQISVKLFLQLLHGLAHAHQQGVVHRALKPENILFDDTGNVVVTDFGLSRVVERDQAVIKHLYVGMGSVAYMAPELFVDPRNVGVQSDLYAAGIILYEMLGRKLPGRRSPMPTQVHASLPQIIDDVFDKLTQDERSDRYTSAEAALEDLHRADGIDPFIEKRAAMIFVKSPLEGVELNEPEPVESSSQALPVAQQAGAQETGSQQFGPQQAGSAGALQVAPPQAAPQQAPAVSDAEGADLAGDGPMPETQEVAGESGSRRRGSRNRPYSFQQRAKKS